MIRSIIYISFFKIQGVFKSVVVRTVGPLWRSVDQGLIESAQTLGASPAQVYRHLLLPIARPAIISAGSLIFVLCFTSYGIIRILGGPGLATLDIEIYRRAVQLGDISGEIRIIKIAQ